jgi:aryl sulfotransferase
MTRELPQQDQSYFGTITNTDRWQNFQHRSDDIFICTPPKCGTTWTQAICAMLIFGTAEHGRQVSKLSPWIDAEFAPIDEYLAEINQQQNRRFIKTHTPFDGIPYYPECTYLVVLRDPRDAYLSGLNHSNNMNDQDLATSIFPHGAHAFEDWLTRTWHSEQWDTQSLDNLSHFFMSYWRYKDLANVHLNHYSDMKLDLKSTIKSMAHALDVEIDAAKLAAFTHAASFTNMKENADQFAPEAGTGMWKAETNFFASGANKQWQDKFSENDLKAFNDRIAELLSADEIKWLLSGNSK